jgi:hypothetical protein
MWGYAETSPSLSEYSSCYVLFSFGLCPFGLRSFLIFVSLDGPAYSALSDTEKFCNFFLFFASVMRFLRE